MRVIVLRPAGFGHPAANVFCLSPHFTFRVDRVAVTAWLAALGVGDLAGPVARGLVPANAPCLALGRPVVFVAPVGVSADGAPLWFLGQTT